MKRTTAFLLAVLLAGAAQAAPVFEGTNRLTTPAQQSKGVWYVSTAATLTDHGVAATTGTAAWAAAQTGDVIEFPPDTTYTFATNWTPTGKTILVRRDAILSPAVGITVNLAGCVVYTEAATWTGGAGTVTPGTTLGYAYRADLASTTAGKGADLVGLPGTDEATFSAGDAIASVVYAKAYKTDARTWAQAVAAAITSVSSGTPVKVVLPPETVALGANGISFDRPNVTLSMYGTSLTYTGTDAAIAVGDSTGTEPTGQRWLVEGGIISGGGAIGIRVGQTANSPYSAVGSLRDIKITGMTTGIDWRSGQICYMDDVYCTLNGRGMILTATTGRYNTATNITNCRFADSTNEGVLINQVWGVSFNGCQFENNGKEGAKLEVLAATAAIHGVYFNHCWFEYNNHTGGVTRSGGPWHQLLIKNNVDAAPIDYVAVRDCTFAIANDISFRHIGSYGNVGPAYLENVRYSESLGALTERGAVGGNVAGKWFVSGKEPSSTWTTVKYKAFTSGGTTEIAPGDTVTGSISGATATVAEVTLASGTWAGGNAAGTIFVTGDNGTFQAENLLVGGADLATIGAGGLNSSLHTWKAAMIQQVLSKTMDLSAAPATVYVAYFKRAARVVSLSRVWTEASGVGHTGTTFKIGKINSGASDDDYYYSGTMADNVGLMTVNALTPLALDIAAGDTVYFTRGADVAAAGEIAVSLEFVYDD